MLGWDDKRPLSTYVSPHRARALRKAGLETVGDFLRAEPSNYFATSRAHQRSGLHRGLFAQGGADEDWALGEIYTCIARVLGAKEGERRTNQGPRRTLTVTFMEGDSQLTVTFFARVAEHSIVLQRGTEVLLTGKADTFGNRRVLKSASYLTIPEDEEENPFVFGNLDALFDIAGKDYDTVHQWLLRPWLPRYRRRPGVTYPVALGLANAILADLPPVPEMLDPDAAQPAWPTDDSGAPMLSFDEALRGVHLPEAEGPERPQWRWKFNQALELLLIVALRRADSAHRSAIPLPPREDGLRRALLDSLPFDLTPGQQEATTRIASALNQDHPAQILLQGDVGSGKTLVALCAMLQACDQGFQAAMVVPTEVLATQHARNLQQLLAAIPASASNHRPVRVRCITAGMPLPQRRAAMLDVMSGDADIVVGTHAILEESTSFFRLGLVVVDEQHRFGVNQRDRLRERAALDATPHSIFMTATPIPRSVAMVHFGDLTPIRLEGLPAGRGRIATHIVRPDTKAERRLYERLLEEVNAGHQVFVVVHRIDGDNGIDATVERIRDRIQAVRRLSAEHKAMRRVRIDTLHGGMHSEDKEEVMRRVRAGAIDVLVATTVIEVGVDVPNATLMIIRNPENFGVSQLHQLRGRVGRGGHDALCLLYTDLSDAGPAWTRLANIASTTDGFELAELDLETRGEGDILGDDQSGQRARRTSLLTLNDAEIIAAARDYAETLVAHDPERARRLVEGVRDEDQDYIFRA